MSSVSSFRPQQAAHQYNGASAVKGTGFAPESSIYTAPNFHDFPGTGNIRNKSDTLFNDGYVNITRSAIWDLSTTPPKIQSATLNIETGNAADRVHVGTTPEGRLAVHINGNLYRLNSRGDDGNHLDVRIQTHGANDFVTVSPQVKNQVTLEGGDGDDTLIAGASRSLLLGGAGDDTLRLGSGGGYAEGNDGDDTIMGGTGNATLYGNNGNDRLYAGAGGAGKHSYLDGGSGNDALYAGGGHSILHGGKGDDYLVGQDRTTFYSGRGRDYITNNRKDDLIYAKAGDSYDRFRGSKITLVSPTTGGNNGLNVMGTPAFKQRIEDDLELLRSSPLGQKTLADLDTLGQIVGRKLPIQEVTNLDSKYKQTVYAAPATLADDDPRTGKIRNNQAGERSTTGAVHFYRPDHRLGTPLTALFHELGHAYNGLTGTFLPGKPLEQSPFDPHSSSATVNTELQVVGLPNSAPLFHFSGPYNPPTNINPEHFTENGIRRELGVAERKSYHYDYLA